MQCVTKGIQTHLNSARRLTVYFIKLRIIFFNCISKGANKVGAGAVNNVSKGYEQCFQLREMLKENQLQQRLLLINRSDRHFVFSHYLSKFFQGV